MNRSLRHAATSLAFAAILLRAAIPSGWMPANQATAFLTLCTTSGLTQIAAADIGWGKSDPLPAPNTAHDGLFHCPFAAAGALGLPSSDESSLPAAFASIAPPWLGSAAINLVNPRIAHRPRAPPTLLISA